MCFDIVSYFSRHNKTQAPSWRDAGYSNRCDSDIPCRVACGPSTRWGQGECKLYISLTQVCKCGYKCRCGCRRTCGGKQNQSVLARFAQRPDIMPEKKEWKGHRLSPLPSWAHNNCNSRCHCWSEHTPASTWMTSTSIWVRLRSCVAAISTTATLRWWP